MLAGGALWPSDLMFYHDSACRCSAVSDKTYMFHKERSVPSSRGFLYLGPMSIHGMNNKCVNVLVISKLFAFMGHSLA